ncbi:MAG: hypothetical protein IT383_12960 [Deltaproteobacteria bacterium]|nr:hypothetical protein [Deltaproteobacteria bacterium]
MVLKHLTLACLLALAACGADDAPLDARGASASTTEAAMDTGRTPVPILDCGEGDNNTKCVECGASGDDVWACCRADCDTINDPDEPAPQPIVKGVKLLDGAPLLLK